MDLEQHSIADAMARELVLSICPQRLLRLPEPGGEASDRILCGAQSPCGMTELGCVELTLPGVELNLKLIPLLPCLSELVFELFLDPSELCRLLPNHPVRVLEGCLYLL